MTPSRSLPADSGTFEPSNLRTALVAVSSDIGRGHPNYLDSVWQALQTRLGPDQLARFTVRELSTGLSRIGWQTLDWLYRHGATGSLSIALYNAIRNAQPGNNRFLTIRLLGASLRRSLVGFKGICLVEHQLLARILSDICRVWYVHGEVSAPPECAVLGAEKILVPLETTEQQMTTCSCRSGQLIRTGLLIEPGLVPGAHDAFHQRLERLAPDRPLTIAFFSSGAYPAAHVRKIMQGVKSVLAQGMSAVVFCGTGDTLLRTLERQAGYCNVRFLIDDRPNQDLGLGPAQLGLVSRETREQDTAAAVARLAQVDAFVAPTHERVNWALGLGLPLFALFPMIGTHAQMNYDFCFNQNVVYPVRSSTDAVNLGASIAQLRTTGALANMAKCGFGRFDINGAERAAQAVVEALA